jgi:hypothetical protein
MSSLSGWGKESISAASLDYQTIKLSAFLFFLIKRGIPLGQIEEMRKDARDIADRNGFASLASEYNNADSALIAALASEIARFFLREKQPATTTEVDKCA